MSGIHIDSSEKAVIKVGIKKRVAQTKPRIPIKREWRTLPSSTFFGCRRRAKTPPTITGIKAYVSARTIYFKAVFSFLVLFQHFNQHRNSVKDDEVRGIEDVKNIFHLGFATGSVVEGKERNGQE